MTAAAEHYESWPGRVASMKQAAPRIGEAFGSLFRSLMGPGALTVREKELIALGIALAARCDPCICSHVEKAVLSGATRQELLELAGVVVVMQGGPGYVSVPKLVEALDALGV